MRWLIHERLKKGEIPPEGELPQAWNTSVSRAVDRLASPARPKIIIESRPLKDWQELVDHFPGKTLIASTRELRLKLLPALRELVDAAIAGPRYYAPQTEMHYVRVLLSQERRSKLRREWLRVKADLKIVFAASDDPTIFPLMVKGVSLFEDAGYSVQRSFHDISKECCQSGALPPVVVARVRAFADAFLSPVTTGSLELRGYIHQFAHASRRGRYTLRDETKEMLRSLRKEYVESLPGFREGKHRFAREPVYGPHLDKLFDQSVFQRFKFMRLAA